MKENYSKVFSDSLKKKLLKVSNKKARIFLYDYGYHCSSFQMPEYYKATGFKKIKLEPIADWNKVPITQSLDIFTPKGFSSWRRFSFIHPYMYWQIVDLMTEERNWEEIKNHLCNSHSSIATYSIPNFSSSKDIKVEQKNIENWLQMAESDLIKDASDYQCLGVTDIQNFYPSIYTHSIAWALHSKKAARNDRHSRKLLGSRLDKLFQNSRDGQTNGIPVGSLTSDIVAEIILSKVDSLLTTAIRQKKLLKKVSISRFRDDYRILGHSLSDINVVLKLLNRILHEHFDLSLNEQKTEIHDDIITNVIRPWSLAINQNFLLRNLRYDSLTEVDFSFLRDVLLETYRIQKNYPQGKPAITVLTKLADAIKRGGAISGITGSNITNLIAILRKIALAREEATPPAISLLDELISKTRTKIKGSFINELASSIKGKGDVDYQAIWLYRLCYSQFPSKCPQVAKEFLESKLVGIAHEKKSDKVGHYTIFPPMAGKKISDNDKKELSKFHLIDRDKFVEVKNVNIDLSSINPINYDIEPEPIAPEVLPF